MPYGDRRGPDGAGAMTGRGLGFCNGYNVPGYLNGGFQRGFGGGRGYGRNRGAGFFAQRRGYAQNYYQPPVLSKEEEKSVLEGEINRLNGIIESLKKRVSDL